jgi:hypothetical protein
MRHQGITAAALTVLAGLAIGAVVHARPPEAEDDLRRQLKELKDEVDTLRRGVELDRQTLRNRLTDLDSKLDRIEGMLRNGAASPPPPIRRASSIDVAPRRSGTIRLDNRLGVHAEVNIDGTFYTVPPLTVRVLRYQPAGTFVYDVTAEGFGITSPKRSTLVDNTTWTLTIY